MKLSNWRLVLAIFCSIIALIYALPNFVTISSNFLPTNTVNLGLDLRGGSHLLLDVDFESYLADTIENLTDNLRKELRSAKIGYKDLIAKQGFVQFKLRDVDKRADAQKIIQQIDRDIIISSPQDSTMRLHYDDSKLNDLRNKLVEHSIEIIRMRVDSTGTKEPIIHKQGERHILLQVPGEENPEELKKLLGKTAKLTFHLVNEEANIEEALKGNVPKGSFLVEASRNDSKYYVVLYKKVIIGGDQLISANAQFDQNSQPAVAFSFNNHGSKIFAEVTKQNRNKRLAIVLDNKLLSDPKINDPILGGSGIISGNFTVESANELALLLRAGALPTPLHVIEERTIGPSLGSDSIESGKKAGIIGFVAVVVFMVLTYGVFGIFANIALVLALLYILALLSLFQATLTLPGIAGIILTIGMAVDANVLIYERIKEEVKKGASNLYAIKMGFETAFATIADSNITTLIAALMLYAFGVGAIKGFAVTLTIGIISSMFAAIIVTKLLVDYWMKYVKPKNLGM